MGALPDVLPPPRTPDPLAAPVLRWGLMGTGWIVATYGFMIDKMLSMPPPTRW